jgi:(1->4)-alpha-D-glucan 1-alpha-D-glucosylmutase
LAAVQRHAKPSTCLTDELTRNWEDGRIKLYAIWKALNFRRARPDLFSKGDFLELKTSGPCAEHVLPYARRHNREWSLFVAPRWLARAQETRKGGAHSLFSETALHLPQNAPHRWQDIFTGDNISSASGDRKLLLVGKILAHFPVAVLSSEKSSRPEH